MKNFIIAPDGLVYIIVLAIITTVAAYFNIYLSIFPFILLAFVVFFFRNPPRKITKNDKHILSPADGKVINISEIYEDEFLKCEAIKISIFLSIFNVHLNRSPICGEIKYTKYRPGKFLPAFKSHASEINERNSVGIQNGSFKIIVNQITGFIARRIVCKVKIGDKIDQGQIYGLIKFGSCTEIIMPKDKVNINVKAGDKVKGGITIIGVIKDGFKS
ncbi:phosphatidylserine decarboxylase family protein [Thermohalobacter berrensis]|uniref:Phosphatidylserine decarboxylase proenzyme n=1 Tax=Thermohalobacter berrensis TaxID=99594 RepID=A0A419T1W3_9FIRM|nr:phosphatidylserine decarboxylase family protein [Thermohalobacter berrensis]RKD31554.1 phosphatidylserine decarboxylase [Thermohalobacter berrensis]